MAIHDNIQSSCLFTVPLHPEALRGPSCELRKRQMAAFISGCRLPSLAKQFSSEGKCLSGRQLWGERLKWLKSTHHLQKRHCSVSMIVVSFYRWTTSSKSIPYGIEASLHRGSFQSVALQEIKGKLRDAPLYHGYTHNTNTHTHEVLLSFSLAIHLE